MMSKQSAHTILMIEPINFGFNSQTAVNNHFQNRPEESICHEKSILKINNNAVIEIHEKVLETTKCPDESLKEGYPGACNSLNYSIQELALAEFNAMVDTLEKQGIDVFTFKDTLTPNKPDSIFPNNWFYAHENRQLALFPMFAENRRDERRTDIVNELENLGFKHGLIKDYSPFEQEGKYLEGTGSLVLDRDNKLAYACLSERTDPFLLDLFCRDFEYEPVRFHAYQDHDGKRLPIYHTNVMMSVGSDFAVICLESIDDRDEKNNVIKHLETTNKKIIEISASQVVHFAGNLLQLQNRHGQKLIVLSRKAYKNLTESQIKSLIEHGTLVLIDIPTIEKTGGGSVRCMIAELLF